MIPGWPVLLLPGSNGYCATGMNTLLWIGSTARVDPPRPEHAAPTRVAMGAAAAPAAKTPTIGKTLPALVAGHFPPSFAFEPDAEYQRRLPGLKPITSSLVACGNCVIIVPS